MVVKLIKIINIGFAGEGACKQLAKEAGSGWGKSLEMSQVEFE